MSIYADKKNGVPTGRWRVELQRKGFKTYKKRWDTFQEAQKDEAAVLASWDAGVAVEGPGKAEGAPDVHTFATTIPLAEGDLWDGNDTVVESFRRIRIVAALMGTGTRLDAIDDNWIIDLVRKLRKERQIADGTVNRYLVTLHKFLVWARKRKYRSLPVDGEDGIEFAWKRESPGRIRWVSPEEEQQLGDYLTNRTHEKAEAARWVWELIQVALETGCRRDELLTCEKDQIIGNRLHLWDTKTDNPRAIPMTEETTERLKALIDSGMMPTQRGLRTWWNKARDHMGLSDDPDFVFHACRHSCATRMAEAEVDSFVIQKWMGHKCIETTLRYTHMRAKNLDRALEKVGEMKSRDGQKSSFSAGSSSSPTSPLGGASA